MDFSLIERDLRNAVSSAIGKSYPISWPNVSFTIPSGPFYRFSIQYGSNEVIAISSLKEQRATGIVTIQVFSESGVGTAKSDEMIYSISDKLDNKSFDYVRTRTVKKKIIGDCGNHYQVNLLIPFISDQQGD